MRVAVFGATGLLGQALVEAWQGDSLIPLSSKDADIRDAAAVRAVLERARPDWIVLAAAYTDVDGCEKNPDLAFEVNHRGAVNVARAAREYGARLLFLSTDYVFDGKKSQPYETDDPRNPQSVYGRSKSEAEVELLKIDPATCIVRTSWLFGMGGRCFPDTILKLVETKKELSVVNDQRGSPTYAPDLAQAIVELCQKKAGGIVHATNRGDCTWFDFASEIIRGARLKTTILPTTSAEFVRPAPRPAYSVLSSLSLAQYQISMPTWQDALGRYLKKRIGPA